MSFQFDTTGRVQMAPDAPEDYHVWADLDCFTQGYIEALFAGAAQDGGSILMTLGAFYGFSDLAPETLTRIVADCAVSATEPTTGEPRREGAAFWRLRNACDYVGFPPLTVQLGDDGKVRFA